VRRGPRTGKNGLNGTSDVEMKMTRFLLRTGALGCALSIAAAPPAAATAPSPAGIPPKSAPSAGDAAKPIDKRPAAKWPEARVEPSRKCAADDPARGHGPAGAEGKDKKLVFKEATEKL